MYCMYKCKLWALVELVVCVTESRGTGFSSVSKILHISVNFAVL